MKEKKPDDWSWLWIVGGILVLFFYGVIFETPEWIGRQMPWVIGGILGYYAFGRKKEKKEGANRRKT